MENIDQTLFYRLEYAVRNYRQFAQREIRAAGYPITIDQWLIIKTISENPQITQHDLAEKVFKDNASVTRMIDLIVKNGYLERYENKNDRRRTTLVITASGKRIISDVSKVIDQNRRAALDKIDRSVLAGVDRFLIAMTENCQRETDSLQRN